jgi:3-phenylpropionate/cinnamic acid dioxygenase small subunit
MSEAIDRDVKQIEQLLYLYAWMVDKREWGLIDQVFSADATIDYASTGGPGRMPHREALEWLDGALKPWPINLHHITNIMPRLDGDRARCRCYFFAPMGRPRAGGGYFAQDIVTNAGFYHDELVRTERGWRISERVCEMTVMIGVLPADYSIPAA